jgi:hypothetical protein
MPAWLSSIILIVSFLFIIWYVVFYPILLTRKIKSINLSI